MHHMLSLHLIQYHILDLHEVVYSYSIIQIIRMSYNVIHEPHTLESEMTPYDYVCCWMSCVWHFMTLYTVDSVHIQVQILPVVVIFHLLVINVIRLDLSPRGSLLRPVGSSYLVTHSLQKVFQMRPIVFPRNEFRCDSNDMGTKTHLPAALASTAQVSRVEISFDLRPGAICVGMDQLMHAWCSLDESPHIWGSWGASWREVVHQ